MKINAYIDHTVLKANTTVNHIKQLCTEAKEHRFYSVCVNSYYVTLAESELMKIDIKIAAVVGFPFGAMASKTKFMKQNNVLKMAHMRLIWYLI